MTINEQHAFLADAFDVRFWGAFTAAQVAKIRPGGSITFTIGQVIVRPYKGWSLLAGLAGAVDSLTRGLAVDLAPIRVNVVSPGVVKTEVRVNHIGVYVFGLNPSLRRC